MNNLLRDFAKAYAQIYLDLKFQVTRIGCGSAGFTDAEIAPMFATAPANRLFDKAWALNRNINARTGRTF